MIVDVPLTDVSPGFLVRDRVVLNREELEALKTSIRAHGQRTAAEITPLYDPEGDDGPGARAYRFGLISGWRRLTALNELHRETGDLRFSTLRAVIRPLEDQAASYVAMIEENEIRVGLSYFERARVVAELTRRGVFPDQAAALRTLFATASKAKRSKIGSFVDLVETLGDALHFPADIPERLGLALVTRLRDGGPAVKTEIRRALVKAAPESAAEELAVLTAQSRPPKPGKVSHAKPEGEVLRSNLVLRSRQKPGELVVTLSGTAADAALLDKLKAFLRQA